MSPVTCLECGRVWASKNKAGRHNTAHRLAYICILCSATFGSCRELHSHEAAARHKPPKDLAPVIAAAEAAAALAGPAAACAVTASAGAGGPSHAPPPPSEDDAEADTEGGGYSCAVCYMDFETQESLADHVSSTLPCAACRSCLDPFQTLEDHYWESDKHPKCRPCALGFEDQAAWTVHQDTCAIAPLRKNNANVNTPGNKFAGAGKQRQGVGYRGPVSTPSVPATKTAFGRASTSSATVSSVTPSSSGSGPWSAPRRPPPKSFVVPPPPAKAAVPITKPPAKAAVSTTKQVPQVPFYCAKCDKQFSSDEELLQHFAGSSSHPKCRTCGMGFESLGQWVAHKRGCPPPGSPTEPPAVVNSVYVSVPAVAEPEATAPEENLTAEAAAEMEQNVPLSPLSLLAVEMMLSYEDGRSTSSPSEHPSGTCSPRVIPQPNGLQAASTETTAGAEEVSIAAEDPLSAPLNDDASSPSPAIDMNGEPEEGALKIPITGRDSHEEMHWYDPALRAKHARPGPGVLPPLLANMLHDPSHALYSVSAEPRPLLPSSPSLAPIPEEVHAAIPHWSALFCPEHNGWVLLQSRTSVSLPPLAREPQAPLPSQLHRQSSSLCGGEEQDDESGQGNLMHHWHRYEKAVDTAALNPPYAHGELLLDLYVCCQCPEIGLVSDVVPGVLPAELVEEFTRDKVAHTAVGKTPEATAVMAWETVLTIIDNRLWKDEKRSLPVGKPRFREKIGWNDQAERVFEALGFTLDMAQCPDGRSAQASEQLVLRPPPIDPSAAEGRASRTRLLRAWVEISAWLAIYKEENKDAFKDYTPMTLHVNVESERDWCEIGIGAHTSQVARAGLPEHVVSEAQLEPSWRALGMIPSTPSWERLAFAYLAQCRCDPANTMVYFTHLVAIADRMADSDSDGGASVPDIDKLRSFIQNEKRQRGRFTLTEHAAYARLLGFGRDADSDSDSGLGMELDDAVEDAFIAQAWRRARQRTWLTAAGQAEKRTQLDDALRLVAELRGSVALVEMWKEESGSGSGMAPETAYQLLGVPGPAEAEAETETDETMLLEAYSMRIENRPGQAERIREALGVVAELRDSERLREFLATGHDPAEDTEIADDANEAPECSAVSTEQYSPSSLSRSVSPATTTATDSFAQPPGKQQPLEDYRPAPDPPSTSRSKMVSFHCRSCLRDPCADPVATVCGHLFCHGCIVDSLATRGCCPVCQKSFLIRLHVEVEVDGSSTGI